MTRHDGTIRWLALAGMAALAVALGNGCGKARGNESAVTAVAAKVRTGQAMERTFRRTVLAHGNVRPVHHAEICARVDGALDMVHFDEGDAVREGEVLFQTDRVNLENQVEVARQELKVSQTMVRQAEIEVEVVRLQAEKAQVDLGRATSLIASQAISQDQFEVTDLNAQRAAAVKAQAEAALAHAQARHEQAASNLAIAEKTMEDSRVKANFSGVVTARFKEPGEYADKAKPVLRIENPEVLEFQAAISAEHYPAIVPGTTRIALRSLEGKPLAEAPVAYRAPSIDPASRTFILKAPLPKDAAFVSGMLCIGELTLTERQGPGVPDVAVLPRANGRWAVLIADHGKARAIGVQIGLSSDGFTEILSADEPLAGRDVIIAGQAFLDDQATVEIVDGMSEERRDDE